MNRYVKLENDELIDAPKNKGNIINYNLNIEQMILDGYKLFVPAEIPQTNRIYHMEYTETKDEIIEELVYNETQQEADARQRNEDIDNKVGELEQFAILEMVRGNDCNVLTIKSIINSLKDAKFDI